MNDNSGGNSWGPQQSGHMSMGGVSISRYGFMQFFLNFKEGLFNIRHRKILQFNTILKAKQRKFINAF